MGSLAFNKEKMNDPRDEEGLFQEAWLRAYHPRDLAGKTLVVAGFLDPSLGEGQSHDCKAVVTVGHDPGEGVYYVLDAWVRHASLDALVRAVLAREANFHYQVFGIEDNFFQRLLLDEFARAAREAGVTLPLKGVTHRLAKETRVAGLSPLVERGILRFDPGQSDQSLLIEQLLHFPDPNLNDDGPDALEGAVSLLRGGGPRVW